MANAGHPFTTSDDLSNVNRLMATSDSAALLPLWKSTRLTAGASPSASTENGFLASVTKTTTGDYTLTFATAFSTWNRVSVAVYKTSGTVFAKLYSPSLSTVRVLCYDAAGSAVDPDYVDIEVRGV